MKIQNLKMQFDNHLALNGIDLSIKKGERIAILGGNGCGKTTLLNVINKGLTATSGRIDYEDFHLTNKNRCYIMQHEKFPEELKVDEALLLFAKSKQNYDYGIELIKKFQLTKSMNKRFVQLSGGEKQKLFLISSLQNEPEYFFLDEITTGLDYNSREDLLSFLSDVFEKNKNTLFLVTHYIEEALRLCNRFVVIKKGKIAEDFTKEELIEQEYSLVKFDETIPRFVKFDEIAPQTYKVPKIELSKIIAENFDHIIHYDRDYTRNLGKLISE